MKIELALRLGSIAVALAASMAISDAQAASCTWNTTTGNWATVADWNNCGGLVPGTGDLATVSATGIVTVNSAQLAGAVSNAGAVNIDAFSLTISGGANSGNSTNGGTITAGTLSTGSLVISNTALSNTGGTIVVNGTGSFMDLFSTTIVGGTLTTTNGGLIRTDSGTNGLTNVTLSSGTQFSVQNGTTLNLVGTIANAGMIQLTGGNNNNGNINIASSAVTLNGGGTISMSAGGGGNAFLHGNGNTLTNVDNSIQGVGIIGDGSLAVINGGTINANSTAGYGSLTLNGASVTNSNGATGGLLEATNGGTLSIQTTVINAGGTITANGGTVQLGAGNGATIEGGTLNTLNSGTMANLGNATLDGSTNGGALTISMGSTLTAGAAGTFTNTNLLGTITNQGTIQLTGGGNADGKLIIASNTVTLNGGGTVTMAAGGGGNAFLGESSNTLINVNNTIQGVGVIDAQTLINGGTINANTTAGYGSLTLNGSGGLTNNGTFAASNGGTLVATVPFTNNGLVNAMSGTINASQGFTGTTGTAQIDATGTLAIGANSTVGTLTNNGATPTALTLGTSNITVSTAYNNANFGVGNSFNNHTNVSGTGQILAAGNVGQGVSGANVTNGTTATPTLTIGNVHVGTTTFNYQVAATGSTGPSLLGAIQTAVNGGNVTDSRLGVTPGNWGPIAPGSSSGNLAVTYTASAAGLQSPLSGQAIHIANNFDNIAGQTMNIVLGAAAAAYNLAAGSATPAPVTIANQRVGGTNSQALTVANTAPAGAFTEVLNASFGLNTGSATNNGGGITGGLGTTGGVSGGSSNNSAMSVGVDTSAAGLRAGTVTINYVSNGTGTSALGNTGVGSQTVTVSGNVYQLAAGQIQTAPLNFGTVQVGQSVSQNLVIRNTATGPAGFVEDLNAGFGSSTDARILGAGSLTGILAGTNSTNANGTMAVSINTGAAGTVNGSIRVNYTSAGAVNGVSNGLGTFGVGGQDYSASGTIVSGQVIDPAKPVINGVANPNPVPVDFGNVRINTAQNQTLNVLNQATGNPQAQLNASIASNGAPVTASGSFTGLLPGNTSPGQAGIGTLLVGIDTSVAGVRSGNATVSLVSDASNVGGCGSNCQMPLPNQTVNANATVYRTANPELNTNSLALAGRVGGVGDTTHLTGAVSITNNSPDSFTEGLTATRGTLSSAPTGGFTGSGSVTNLAAQGTSTAIQVSLNTGTSGAFTGSQALNFVSTGAGTTGAPDLSVGSGSVTLAGNVYTPAIVQVNTIQPISLGIVHVGDPAPQAPVSITNAANGALNDSLLMSFQSASSGFSGGGNLGPNGLAAGATDPSGLHVSMNTATAGTLGGTVSFSATSHDSQLADLALATLNVAVQGQVNNFALSAFQFGSGAGTLTHQGSTYTLDFGTRLLGSVVLTSILFAGNGAIGPADLLNGMFQLMDPSHFGETGFNSFEDLAAQQFTAGPLGLTFDTSSLGSFVDTIVLHGVGHNASGYSAPVDDITLVVEGTVIPPSTVPEPGTLTLTLLALGCLLLAYRVSRVKRIVRRS